MRPEMLEVLEKYRKKLLALVGATIFFSCDPKVKGKNGKDGFQIKKFLYRKRNTWPGELRHLNR